MGITNFCKEAETWWRGIAGRGIILFFIIRLGPSVCVPHRLLPLPPSLRESKRLYMDAPAVSKPWLS